MKYYKQVMAGFNKDRPIIEVVESVESYDLRVLAYGMKHAIDRISRQEIQHVRKVGHDYITYEFPRLYVRVLYLQDGNNTEVFNMIKDCACVSHMSPYPAYQMTHSARNLAEGLIDDLTGQGALGWRQMEYVLNNPQLKVS